MFTLKQPIEVGGLADRLTVSRLEIASISINLQKGHVAQGNGVLSLVLEDPDSGYQVPFTYRNPSVLEFVGGIKDQLTALLAPIWEKLEADGMLPEGTVEVQIPQEIAIDAVVEAMQTRSATLASPVPQVTP